MTPKMRRLAALLALAAAGCGSPKADLAEVTGTLTKGGKPLPGVRVTFAPEYEKGMTEGRSSAGLTDDGKYALTFNDQTGDHSGALVGRHKVTLTDVAWENDRDNPNRGPIRVPPVNQQTASTPLTAEVQVGRANFADLEVK